MSMTRVPNRFIDPATNNYWDWPINHNDETGSSSKSGGAAGLNRNITVSAPTSNGLHIRQETAPDPITFSWKGTALTRAQHQQFLAWYKLGQDHSIILRDFSGDEWEVLFVSYVPTRRPVAQNRNDMTSAPMWVYDFQCDFEVVKAISGDLASAGITGG